MPTKRKRVTRGRRGTLTMDSLPLECLLQFMAGWSPPKNEFDASRSRWQTWPQFIADWLAVREECLASEPFQVKGTGDDEIFAEQVLKTFEAKGPPANITYEELRAAFEAAEDRVVAEILADIEI